MKGRPQPQRSPGEQPPIPVIVDERLREKDPGRLEGLTRAGIIKRFPLEAEAYGQLGKFYYRPPGGESWCDVILRLRSLVDSLRAEYAGGRVLIVSHQVVVVCLRYVLEGLDEERVLGLERPGEVANSSFTSYRRADDRLVLEGFNGVEHLADVGVAVTAEPPVAQPLDPPVDGVVDSHQDAPERAAAPSPDQERPAGSPATAAQSGYSGRLSDSPREITARLLAEWSLPAPGQDADKDARGHVVIVGGDARVPGGALLAATAVLRAGAGRVQLAVAAPVAAALGVAVPEALVQALPATDDGAPDPEQLEVAEELCRKATAVVVGPGLLDPQTGGAILAPVAGWMDEGVLVVDAAALAGVTEELGRRLDGRLVLTPNAIEAAFLLDSTTERIAADLDATARTIATRFRATVALKGRETRVVGPDGCLFVNRAGNVGLAVSGSGDALVGIVGGLVARGASPVQAMVWAVHLHALAADELAEVAGPLGYLPRELPDRLPALLGALGRAGGEDGVRGSE
ncbi:MAG: NAD(P)H-hydrate dehydratase [Thermomicrobiales bacterium]